MFLWRLSATLLVAVCLVPTAAYGQNIEKDVCPRPNIGGFVPEPVDLRSQNGVLKVELSYANFRDARGQMHFCYRDGNGNQAPNLRVHPGDWLIVTLRNNLSIPAN